jgi:hypothetical protein
VQQLEYWIDELQFKFDSSPSLQGSMCDSLDTPSIFLILGYSDPVFVTLMASWFKCIWTMMKKLLPLSKSQWQNLVEMELRLIQKLRCLILLLGSKWIWRYVVYATLFKTYFNEICTDTCIVSFKNNSNLHWNIKPSIVDMVLLKLLPLLALFQEWVWSVVVLLWCADAAFCSGLTALTAN